MLYNTYMYVRMGMCFYYVNAVCNCNSYFLAKDENCSNKSLDTEIQVSLKFEFRWNSQKGWPSASLLLAPIAASYRGCTWMCVWQSLVQKVTRSGTRCDRDWVKGVSKSEERCNKVWHKVWKCLPCRSVFGTKSNIVCRIGYKVWQSLVQGVTNSRSVSGRFQVNSGSVPGRFRVGS